MSTDATREPRRPPESLRTGPATVESPRWLTVLAQRPWLVLVLVLVVLIGVTSMIQPAYLSLRGLRNTLLLAAPVGIMAAGQTILMLTRGIDLSVAMIATVAAYVVGFLAPQSLPLALLAGLLVGVGIGVVNGVGVGVFRVHPLIMTLAMSAILLGWLSQAAQSVFVGATSMPPFVRLLGAGSFLGNVIPYNTIVWALVAVVVLVGLRYTGLGRMLYAIGDNPTAARLAGVRAWQVLLAAYAVAGMLAAVGGMLIAGQTGAVDLRLAQEFLLPSIAAAVIGGTSLFGGVGSYAGTILGALILGVLNTMLIFLNAPQAGRQIVFGVIIIGLSWLYAAALRRS